MRSTVRVDLPGGVVRDGVRRTDAVLRQVTGADEEALQAQPAAEVPALAELVLLQCVEAIAGADVDRRLLRSLTVGDHEALLWHLRRVTFGDRLDAVVECSSCHEKLDVALQVGDLLQEPYDEWTAEHAEELDGRAVVFRVPTVADLAAVAEAAARDVDAGAHLLLRRCVRTIDGAEPTAAGLDAVRGPVERRIAELDPQAEALLTMRCPACGAAVSTTLDAAAFLVEELARRGRHLPAEVHTIAWYYHWSEAEILGLPVERRHRYLELIADAVHPGGAP